MDGDTSATALEPRLTAMHTTTTAGLQERVSCERFDSALRGTRWQRSSPTCLPSEYPPAMATALTHDDFEAFVRLLCPRAAAEGLSVVARSAASGQLIGALVADDPAGGPLHLPEPLARRFAPIFDILGQLDDEYRTQQPPAPRPMLHIFLIGVHERWCGRGIGRHLIARCIENGAALGYRVAVTEATNRRSQNLFAGLGFNARVQRWYADHCFEGRAVSAIAQEGGPVLMDAMMRPHETEQQFTDGV